MELWKVVEGTNGALEISSHGRVKSNLRDGRILKVSADAKGYLRLRVTIERNKYAFKIHRLVAEAFIPNPDNKPQVNHVDGDKKNNCVDNLEWVTNKENSSHAMDNGLWNKVLEASRKSNEERSVKVISIDPETMEEKTFESINAANKYYHTKHVGDVLKGKRNKAAGYYFRKGVV